MVENSKYRKSFVLYSRVATDNFGNWADVSAVWRTVLATQSLPVPSSESFWQILTEKQTPSKVWLSIAQIQTAV